MFSCYTCQKIIGQNSMVYMFQDKSYCSDECRNINIKKYFEYRENRI